MMKFNNEGLVPVVVQDAMTKEVLMLAYANEEPNQQKKQLSSVEAVTNFG